MVEGCPSVSHLAPRRCEVAAGACAGAALGPVDLDAAVRGSARVCGRLAPAGARSADLSRACGTLGATRAARSLDHRAGAGDAVGCARATTALGCAKPAATARAGDATAGGAATRAKAQLAFRQPAGAGSRAPRSAHGAVPAAVRAAVALKLAHPRRLAASAGIGRCAVLESPESSMSDSKREA